MNVLKFRLALLLLALLPMAWLSAQTLVFEETFENCNKTGGYKSASRTVYSSDVYDYEEVNSQDEIVSGEVYLLVAKISETEGKAASSFSMNKLSTATVALTGNNCVFEGNVNTNGHPYEFTIVESGDNYHLKTFDDKKLAGVNDKTDLSTLSSSSSYYLWNINFGANYGVFIRSSKMTSRGLVYSESYDVIKNYTADNVNSTNEDDRYYPISLYRRVAKKGEISIKTDEGYGTFYSEKPFVMPEGVTGGIITNTDGVLSFEAMYPAGATVPAETALLVKADSKGTYVFDYTMSAETAPEGNCLYGGNSLDESGKTYVGENYKYYVLSRSKSTQELGFYWAATDGAAVTYQSGMAFLALSREAAQNNSVAFVLDFDATGIESIDNGQLTMDNETIYDLSGRKVANPVKGGIYVKGGKKFIVK